MSGGPGSLAGEKANGIRDLAGVGEGLGCHPRAAHELDAGVEDQKRDVDAAWTQLERRGVPNSLGGSLAWIVGILALFVPFSVWRYRRMS